MIVRVLTTALSSAIIIANLDHILGFALALIQDLLAVHLLHLGGAVHLLAVVVEREVCQ